MRKNHIKTNYKKYNSSNKTENYVLLGMLGTTILSGALLTLPSALADDVVDTITITVPSSCSMSSTIASGNEHTAEINNGQYDSNIGETTIKAFCNDNEGFAIYAIGYTDNELGKNVLTNSTLGSTHDIVTGTAITGNISNWAMKLSTITSPTPNYPIIITGSTDDTEKEQDDPDFSDFTEVPDEYEKVAYRTSATDINSEGSNTAEGSTLKTTYQAYISPTQAAGEYTGQVKYTMVHPASHSEPFIAKAMDCVPGKICYYPNTDEHEGTMGQQELTLERDWSACNRTDYATYCRDSSYHNIDISTLPELDTYQKPVLLATNFSRDGYGFAGWSDVYDYETNSNAHFYGPNETIDLVEDILSDGLSLYAVWIESEGSMQDSAKLASLCGAGENSLTIAPIDGTADLSSVSALTDQRDGQVYSIAKLADGSCWMIENLRLEAEDSMGEENIALAQGYREGFTGLMNKDDGCSAMTMEGCYDNRNTHERAANPDNFNNPLYGYGNTYTSDSAIAGYYGGDTSICPAGWRLPYGNDNPNSNGSFRHLDVLMGGTGLDQKSQEASLRWRKFPVNYVYSSYNNMEGIYWTPESAGCLGACFAYALYLTGSGANPTANVITYNYGSIRCVFDY